MTYSPRAYDEFDSSTTMQRDAAEAGSLLGLPPRVRRSAADRLAEQPPSLLYADFPRDTKPQIRVSAAAARLAAAMELHLD